MMSEQELLETITAQQEYNKQLEQEKADLQADFDNVAISLIEFAKDFGVEDMIKGGNTNTGKILSKVGLKLMSGKISFEKLEKLAPLFTKYQDRYHEHLKA
jgi:hypothetical protein